MKLKKVNMYFFDVFLGAIFFKPPFLNLDFSQLSKDPFNISGLDFFPHAYLKKSDLFSRIEYILR